MGILGQRNPSKPLKEFPIRRRSIQFRRGTPMSEPMFSDVVIHPRYPCRWPPELKWPNSNFSEFPEMWRFESEDLKKVLNLEISAKFLIRWYVFFWKLGCRTGSPDDTRFHNRWLEHDPNVFKFRIIWHLEGTSSTQCKTWLQTWLSEVVDALLLPSSNSPISPSSVVKRFRSIVSWARRLSSNGAMHMPFSSSNCSSWDRLRNCSWLHSTIASSFSSSVALPFKRFSSVNFLIYRKNHSKHQNNDDLRFGEALQNVKSV